MIVTSRCTLSIYSATRTVAEITAALGIVPHSSHDKGEPTRSALAGRPSFAGETYDRTN